MLLRGTLILVGLWSMSPRPPAKILLTGTAQLCPEEDTKGDTAGVRGVHVYAFDAAKVPRIRASLAALDTISWSGDGVEAMHTFSAEYAELMTLLKQTPNLGGGTSNGNGDFRITVPRADSVLLFAEEELEDQPFFFASKVIATKQRSELRIVLPMCNKRV
jgi:hypothetical protein